MVPPASSAPAVTEGVVYALVVEATPERLTWDQVDLRPQQCEAVQGTIDYQEFFEACYSNDNPQTRSAPVAAEVTVRISPGTAPQRSGTAQTFPQEVTDAAENDIPVAYRVWQLTVRAGVVVAVEQAPAASA